jgi:hypothetical protein
MLKFLRRDPAAYITLFQAVLGLGPRLAPVRAHRHAGAADAAAGRGHQTIASAANPEGL